MRNVEGAMPTKPGVQITTSTPNQSVKRGRSDGQGGPIAGSKDPGKITRLTTNWDSKHVRPTTESGGSEVSNNIHRGYPRNEANRATGPVMDANTNPDGSRRLIQG